MATTSELNLRIDRNLRIVRLDLADLPEIDAMYEDARKQGNDAWWKADWSGRELEWRDMVNTIEWLSRQYRDGAMSDEQAQHYREVVSLLQERVPVLKRLKWVIPLVSVDSLS